LIAAGALTRIGRRLVVLGLPFDAWLRANQVNVESYEPPGITPGRQA
jgi:hypothetical protein